MVEGDGTAEHISALFSIKLQSKVIYQFLGQTPIKREGLEIMGRSVTSAFSYRNTFGYAKVFNT